MHVKEYAATVLKGYESFYTRPAELDLIFCRVCGTRCEVSRSRRGPTGFAMAMGGGSVLHDYFVCPQVGAPWHAQARALVREIAATQSPGLERILCQDLVAIIEARGEGG